MLIFTKKEQGHCYNSTNRKIIQLISWKKKTFDNSYRDVSCPHNILPKLQLFFFGIISAFRNFKIRPITFGIITEILHCSGSMFIVIRLSSNRKKTRIIYKINIIANVFIWSKLIFSWEQCKFVLGYGKKKSPALCTNW